MPEPAGYILHWPAGGGSTRELFDRSRVAADVIGCKASPLYTADQVREAMKAVAERCAAEQRQTETALLWCLGNLTERANHEIRTDPATGVMLAWEAIRPQAGGDHE